MAETRMFCATGDEAVGVDARRQFGSTLGERLVNLARVAAAVHMSRCAEQRGSAEESAEVWAAEGAER